MEVSSSTQCKAFVSQLGQCQSKGLSVLAILTRPGVTSEARSAGAMASRGPATTAQKDLDLQTAAVHAVG